MWTVAKREIGSYFKSPIAYVLIGLFILLISIFFWPRLQGSRGDFISILGDMGFFLIFIVPILTMKILAEDRKNGTEVLLMTSPTSLFKIVLGKFIAAYTVFLVITIISLIYPIIIVIFSGAFTIQLAGGYLGFLLLGGAFISIGVLASASTENQIIAAIISFVALLVMWVADTLSASVGGVVGTVLTWISLISRYQVFTKGILGFAEVIYLISFTAIILFLTVRLIERRRWTQG
ncbi:MAG: ABC transporter permease [Clostridia bacterium]|nr:ABC transporter permease [Clostridia bacterium]